MPGRDPNPREDALNPHRSPDHHEDSSSDDASWSAEDLRRLDAIRRDLEREFECQVIEDRPGSATEPGAAAGHGQTAVPATSARVRPRPTAVRGARSARGAGGLFITTFVLGATIGGTAGALLTALVPPHEKARSAGPPPSSPSTRRADAQGPASIHGDERAMDDIRRALRAWTAAASRNDIDALTAFYPPRVPVYHAWRDVTREEVGAEKRRTLDPSRVAEMDAGRAEITLGADGRTATTRVPKRDMGKGAADRDREAIQELRWIQTIDGWKIIGERELEVTSSRRTP